MKKKGGSKMRDPVRYAEAQVRFWLNKLEAAKIELASKRLNAEKESEGKEILPPNTPNREKEEKEKDKNKNENTRVRAEEIPSIEEIAAECQRIGTNIDPEYFWNYYQAKDKGWPRHWKSALSNWSKTNKKFGRIKEETVTAERKEVDLQEIQQREFERVLRHLQEEEAAHRKEQNHGN